MFFQTGPVISVSKHRLLKHISWHFLWPPMARQKSKPNLAELWDGWAAL